jgi:MraZ protein
MSDFFFSGSATAKLDDKNRFVIPQAMRYGLVEEGKLEFTIALGLGGCLAIYKKSDIDEIVKKFQAKQHVAKFQKFFTMFFSTLHHTTCDSIGRVTIPAILKKAAKIDKEIVVAGVLDKIELWPQDKYEEDLAKFFEESDAEESPLNDMMEDAFALLAEGEEEEPKVEEKQEEKKDAVALLEECRDLIEKTKSEIEK